MSTTSRKSPFHRKRSRPIQTCVVPPWRYRVLYWDGSETSGEKRPGSAVVSYQTFTDVVTPNFRKLISDGFFINNPMSKQTASYSIAPMDLRFIMNNRPYGAFSTDVTYMGVCIDWDHVQLGINPADRREPPSVLTDSDPRRALTKAYANANGQSLQLLVELAEFEKTLLLLSGLLTESMHALQRCLRILNPREIAKLKRKGVRILTGGKLVSKTLTTGKKAGAAAGSRYLQWHYGMMPLVLSIRDAQNAIRELLDRSFRVTGRGGDSDTRTASQTYSGIYPYYDGGPLAQPYDLTTTVSRTTKSRAYVVQELSLSASRVLGIDLTSVPGAIYELIPYSWMADWFLNVGDWLKAVNTTPGIRVLGSGCSTTDTTTTVRQLSLHAHSYSEGSGYGAWSASASAGITTLTRTETTKNRDVNLSIPILPQATGLHKAMSPLTHRLDVLSLGFQSLGKRR